MATVTYIPTDIVYPESDGQPMAETDVHRDEMIDLIKVLDDRYVNDQDVYVSGNLLLYYEEGNPSAVVSPDVFLVRGVPKHQRRTYKLWEERVPPTVVFEITSRSTRLDDIGNKRALYASLGVREYFLFDPLAEYLQPPLQGFALQGDDYVRLLSDADGSLVSQALDLRLVREDNRLRLIDVTTGERLLRPLEVMQARRDAEAELVQLRAEFARLRGEGQ